MFFGVVGWFVLGGSIYPIFTWYNGVITSEKGDILLFEDVKLMICKALGGYCR